MRNGSRLRGGGVFRAVRARLLVGALLVPSCACCADGATAAQPPAQAEPTRGKVASDSAEGAPVLVVAPQTAGMAREPNTGQASAGGPGGLTGPAAGGAPAVDTAPALSQPPDAGSDPQGYRPLALAVVDEAGAPRESGRAPAAGSSAATPAAGTLPELALRRPAGMDARLFQAINLKPGRKDALDPLFQAAMPLGDRSAAALALSIYVAGQVTDAPDLRQAGILTAAALVSSGLLTEGLKGIVARRRPVERLGLDKVRVVGKTMADGRSFPSGHAATAFAWATVLSGLYPEGTALMFGAASVVAFGRVRVGAHYPSDVLAGAAIGFTAGQFVLANRNLLLRRSHHQPGSGSVEVSRQFHF